MEFSRPESWSGCLSLLQGIFPTQGLNPGFLHCRQILYQLSYQGSPWMWELDHKEGWALKNWCFWTVVLERTLESPLDCKEIKPDHSKGNQSWIFIGGTDAEAEAPKLWPPDTKNWLWKDPDAVKDWRWEEKDGRGWDVWMVSLTQSTWVCVNSGSWWWTGKPGILQSMGSQRVRHDWVTKLNWTDSIFGSPFNLSFDPLHDLGFLSSCQPLLRQQPSNIWGFPHFPMVSKAENSRWILLYPIQLLERSGNPPTVGE